MHWLYDPLLSESSTELSPSEAQHAKSLRLNLGEDVTITNGLGLVAVAKMTSPNTFEITTVEHIQPLAIKFHLVQALAKSDRDEMALQAACELGVSSVTPWESARSIVKWDGKSEKNRARWEQIAISAMKQSQQAHRCEIEPLTKTKDLRPKGVGLILVPGAQTSIATAIDSAKEITLVVGPEGGLPDSEIQQLIDQGFKPVRLGSSVLRTSTAGPAAIAALQLALGNWD